MRTYYVEEAVGLVPNMKPEEKLKAVQLWNLISEKLQEIVNNSAADINALAMKMDTDDVEKDLPILPEMPIEDPTDKQYLMPNSQPELLPQTEEVFISRNNFPVEQSNKPYQYEACEDETILPSLPAALDSPSFPPTNPIAYFNSPPCLISSPHSLPVPYENDSNETNERSPVLLQKKSSSPAKNVKQRTTSNYQKNTISAKESENTKITVDVDRKTESMKTSISGENNSEDHQIIHKKSFECEECGSRFALKGNLDVHKRSHTGEKPYHCNLCEAKFTTNGNLGRHIKTHSGEKPFECQHCGKCYTEQKSLKIHMRQHTGERPFECHVCKKRFTQSGILQTHMTLHQTEKDYLCHHCGRAFRQRSQLKLHLQRHQGIKKHDCDTCTAKFLTKGDLERHLKTHTGDRPFSCHLCNKTLTRQQSLNEHMNRHYGFKPYECKYCKKKFSEMSACYKHIKKHKDNNDEEPLDQIGESTDLTIQEEFIDFDQEELNLEETDDNDKSDESPIDDSSITEVIEEVIALPVSHVGASEEIIVAEIYSGT